MHQPYGNINAHAGDTCNCFGEVYRRIYMYVRKFVAKHRGYMYICMNNFYCRKIGGNGSPGLESLQNHFLLHVPG